MFHNVLLSNSDELVTASIYPVLLIFLKGYKVQAIVSTLLVPEVSACLSISLSVCAFWGGGGGGWGMRMSYSVIFVVYQMNF
jgi:hypothetical protein